MDDTSMILETIGMRFKRNEYERCINGEVKA